MFPSASRANRDFSPSCWKIPAGWTGAPGQFVMLQAPELGFGADLGASLFHQQSVAAESCAVLSGGGTGTERIARLVSGDKVTIWGPLGTGFAVEAGRPTLLLGRRNRHCSLLRVCRSASFARTAFHVVRTQADFRLLSHGQPFPDDRRGAFPRA